MLHDVGLATLIVCIAAAFLAGFVDAVAGGGGLIQLPVLLSVFPHLPLATVSGTNKSVSVIGTAGAATTYARRMRLPMRMVGPMAIAAFAGSACGAALITHVDRSAFEPIIVVLLIGVTIVTITRPELGRTPREQQRGPIAASALGAGIGFYDGIMGPGTGMFLVMGLVAYVGSSFLASSAMAKFVNVATNLAALAVFVPSHNVVWAVTLAMAPANLLGGLVGAHTALNRGSAFVRLVFLGMIALLVVRLISSIAR